MVNQTQTVKVYIAIVEQLRSMIEQDRLMPGDKIPSERELSERLDVGRSSVREALRAMELLGLIETRRGEGTFIKDFQDHRLVELLGTFFLQDARVQEDLLETKYLIEMDCIRIIAASAGSLDLEELLAWTECQSFDAASFFERLARLNRNRLMERIWTIVNSYTTIKLGNQSPSLREPYIDLAKALVERNETKALDIYTNRIRKLSSSL
ncbi:FadR/GntR family transcriptional regulator [Peribacillus sp. SCS-155]|uniref:FadR/GntR family transcriptional regulator n=1 Tax=Peribacillus sedimenti TaxID=3115297 RepID=UPI003905A201